MRTLDLSTISGILFSILMVLLAIDQNGSIADFVDVPAVLIVFLGTILITTASFSFADMFKSPMLIAKMTLIKPKDPKEIALKALEIAAFTYKEGVLALDKRNDLDIKSNLFKKGLSYIVDGEKPASVEKLISQEIMRNHNSRKIVISIFRKAAEVAPAMGLIGTLIGLVQMLGSLSDVKNIGPAMSVALLTTFYGAVFAYMVLFPMASKFDRVTEKEFLNNEIYLYVLVSISKHEPPRQLETTLNSLLPPEKKIMYFD